MSIRKAYKLFRLATSNESSKPYSAETETSQHTQHTADFWAVLYNKKLPELTVGQRAIKSSKFNALCFQHVQQLQLWPWVLFWQQQQPQQTFRGGPQALPKTHNTQPSRQAEHVWERLCLSHSSWDAARRHFSLLPLLPSQPSNNHWRSHLFDIHSSLLIWCLGETSNWPQISQT